MVENADERLNEVLVFVNVKAASAWWKKKRFICLHLFTRRTPLPALFRLHYENIERWLLMIPSALSSFSPPGQTQREGGVRGRSALPIHRRLLPEHQVPGRQCRARASSGLVHSAQCPH